MMDRKCLYPRSKALRWAVFLFAFPASVCAQSPSEPSPAAAGRTMDAESLLFSDWDRKTLEELLNTLTDIASKKSLSTRETPGIVTLLSQEEISNSGARDLIDILRLVPGFEFGVDVQGVTSVGMRGVWGHEGKILLLVDGQPYNELLYSTLPLGNRIPVDHIKQVEIIRGPGSAIYGGFAELAVINITTKGAKDINGAAASFTYGQMEKAYGRRNANVSMGRTLGGAQISAAGFFGTGQRSDRFYTDFAGDRYNMEGRSSLDPRNLNIGLGYKGLSTRLIIDQYNTTAQDEFGTNLPEAAGLSFTSYFFDTKYDLKAGEKLVVTPNVRYTHQKPWKENSALTFYDKTVERYTGNLTASYDFTNRLNVLGGLEVYNDRAKVSDDTD
ncbi:MAG: TonB-dependent receptor plug domain-containing protein, partial [Elusimicrobia bacterium]|nr:TonB-dependent receptor plug domain-containing protein [Elusimicrobiota bacterium]